MLLPHALTSKLLSEAGFRHAFFTRTGGVSRGPFESLNFSASVGDDPTHVHENFERAGQFLHLPNESLCHLNQVHGRGVVQLAEQAVRSATATLDGDALISECASVACAVRTADCVPILVADVESGAVAAIHAGWRGIVAGVVESALQNLKRLTVNGGQLVAAVGPHISLAAFEISDDVAQALESASSANGVVDRISFPKPHADLRKIVHAQLATNGVTEIDDVLGCTLLEPDRFFSFRRSGVRSGRHLSAIVARGHREGLLFAPVG
ncbi:MAG: peptidoglycan editing factor PgeF [Polyangiaceae bacterium]|nr:peptidoglycan editing factor PgeF [Polyangiaceae bacterium]